MSTTQVDRRGKTPALIVDATSRDKKREGARIDVIWSKRRYGFLVAVAAVTALAMASAWLTPRGPTTTTAALISIAAALVAGGVIGFATPNRWSMLAAPVVFVAIFELARLGVVGPTVDAINLGSFYGIVAFVLGRLFHGLLVLGPMVLGSVYGVWLAGKFGHPTAHSMGAVGWVATILASIGLVALSMFIARPASTAPILGADGSPIPGSVAELTTVTIGGHDQVMMIRGRSAENPVILYLTGGPGGTDLGAMRRDTGLEGNFVVVTWDQRGAGKSYAALDPVDTFTLDQFVADTIEVTDFLRERFDEDKIFLVGQSWGSTLGALAAAERPDLYHALIGVGQMVSQRETDILFWEDSLSWAEETGNTELAETLTRNGPPPYSDLNRYDPVISHEHEWNSYPSLDLDNEMPAILFVPEYTFMDRINAFKAFLDTNGTLYPQLQGIDFRQDLPELAIPYYLVLGEYEARGRAVLANEWYEALRAPSKEKIVLEDAGHRAHFDQPATFAQLMRDIAADRGITPTNN